MAEERKQMGSRLPKALVVKLGKIALDRDVPLNDIIEGALVDWYNAQPEQPTYGPEKKSDGAAKATPSKSEQSTPKKEESTAPAELGSVTKDPPQKGKTKEGAKRK